MARNGTDPCEALEWDTAFWGFPIARVRGNSLTEVSVRAIDSWCHHHQTRCLYFLSHSEEPTTARLAEVAGFRLVDIRVTFRYRCGDRNGLVETPQSGVSVRGSRLHDVEALQAIAADSHQSSRFYHDDNFPRQLCSSLYATWIKVSCEGYADAVLVAELGGVPVGYVSCHLDRETSVGRIGLVGVNGQTRNRGVGQSLVTTALDWFRVHGAKEVCVVTQGRNGAAQNLYQRCRFLTGSVQLWYHKWYPPVEVIQ